MDAETFRMKQEAIMKLNRALLDNSSLLEEKGISLPGFDAESVKEKTFKQPTWIHFGPGNIFRAFPAAKQQQLLNHGIEDTGIIVAEGYDYQIADLLKGFDNLTINTTLKESGEVDIELIASIVDYLKLDRHSEDFNRLEAIFTNPSLQMATFTITEKGYSIVNNQGEFLPDTAADFANGPENTESYLGKIMTLLYKRYKAGSFPLAFVSMDNMSQNGKVLEAVVETFAEEWVKRDLVDQGFLDYVTDSSQVSFPWSMIDKITPRPDRQTQDILTEKGFESLDILVTDKQSYVSPFVNGEETEYLVIEDVFPNGRAQLEEAGIIFTDRKTVHETETMKVTTCLNPLHTALAIFGCLLGYESIHEEMQDKDLVRLVKQLGYDEGLPVVVDPEILDPKEFIDQVINVRFPNPFIPDTPQRIASDTSQKLSVRFGETLKSYMASDKYDVQSLEAIPLTLAGWLRYLSGINDEGKAFALSPDPLLSDLQPLFKDYELGDTQVTEGIKELLQNEKIFGVNLASIGLDQKVLNYYERLSKGTGAVRETLQEALL